MGENNPSGGLVTVWDEDWASDEEFVRDVICCQCWHMESVPLFSADELAEAPYLELLSFQILFLLSCRKLKRWRRLHKIPMQAKNCPPYNIWIIRIEVAWSEREYHNYKLGLRGYPLLCIVLCAWSSPSLSLTQLCRLLLLCAIFTCVHAIIRKVEMIMNG